MAAGGWWEHQEEGIPTAGGGGVSLKQTKCWAGTLLCAILPRTCVVHGDSCQEQVSLLPSALERGLKSQEVYPKAHGE